MKKITLEEWKRLVSLNCADSYSYAVCFAILNIWEAKATDEKSASLELKKLQLGLSGFQAMGAIEYALTHDASEWLDTDMIEVSK